MNRLRAFSPHCEMNGFGANVLLRTVDAYHRRLESLFLPPNHPSAQHCVDRHAQYFSLLRKGLVYSAGNDPNPADICPTGRGALTQVCHFISTVKSIKSTHTEGLFFHACTVFVSFFFFFFFFLGGAVFFSMKIFFQELKFTQVLKCILESLDEAIQKQQDQNIFPLPPKCLTNVQYSTAQKEHVRNREECMD